MNRLADFFDQYHWVTVLKPNLNQQYIVYAFCMMLNLDIEDSIITGKANLLKEEDEGFK